MDLDITITACRRPEILTKTLTSFYFNMLLKNYDCEVSINIDPVGTGTESKTLDACALFFPDFGCRAPEEPNFSKAFKWVWQHRMGADYVLHLEDDWELLKKVDLMDMVDILENNPKLALLRLPQFKADGDRMKNWNKFFPWNGEYFECPEELKMSVGFCGHPSLIKREFIENTVNFIDTTKNPEKQFHRGPKEIMEEVAKWSYGVYGTPKQSAMIRDIGRRWMVENKWKKKGSKAYFMEWEKS